MPSLRWSGPPPSRPVATLLSRAGFAPVVSHRSPATVVVVATRDATKLPQAPEAGLAWVWACEEAIPPRAAIDAVLRGAYDAISLEGPDGAQRLAARVAELFRPSSPPPKEASFVAESEAAKAVLAQVARAAATSMPVLLTGETGSGKEVTARLIHKWSVRRDKRFVPVNCAAIPNELMEAELFGYARGAFSGAVQRFDGQLVAGESGTVFLDEIDDTPLSLQHKLLRVLEDRVVQRIGESEPRKVDFRVVAATNRDLRPLIASGAFGADFYERLAIVTIRVPPLRERLEDLAGLAAHFIARFDREEPADEARPHVTHLHPDALHALAAYPWPGNVRELRNVLFEALVYKRAGTELLLGDLPRRVLRRQAEPSEGMRDASAVIDRSAILRQLDAGTLDLRREMEQLERFALEAALAKADGNAAGAARHLGRVGRGDSADPGSTVRAMMRRLGVSPPARKA